MGKIEKDKLIRMIRRHPILYNPYHKDYTNIHKKCKVWNAVGLKFNESGETIKKVWRSLRDAFAKYMKRVNTGEILKPWVWKSEMDFYLPFLPSSSQPEIVYEEMDNSDYEYLNSDTNMTGEIERDSYIISEPIESVLIVGDPPETTEIEEDSSFDIMERRPQKRMNVSQEQQTSMQDHFRKKKLNVLFDDMDCLLLAHAKTIKTFSRKRQAVIKYKIAQVIMEQELLHFQEQKELTDQNKRQRMKDGSRDGL